MRNWLVAHVLIALSASIFAANLDLNQATEADLDSLRGIGPATTAKILKERAKGPFKNWDDFIARVPGIGPVKAHQLSRDGLRVNGATAPQR